LNLLFPDEYHSSMILSLIVIMMYLTQRS
jgi:hypothetical protein